MSEIPEDLRHQHKIATVAYSVQCYTGREVVRLIERIAALEAENGRLRAVLTQIAYCKEHPQCTAARAARAALAQQPAQDNALATSIAQTAEWTKQANKLTVANDEKAGRIIQLQEQVRMLREALSNLCHGGQHNNRALDWDDAEAVLARTEPEPTPKETK